MNTLNTLYLLIWIWMSWFFISNKVEDAESRTMKEINYNQEELIRKLERLEKENQRLGDEMLIFRLRSQRYER